MMAEWGISFDHIEHHWTDRQFVLMSERLCERKTREAGKPAKSADPKKNPKHLSM